MTITCGCCMACNCKQLLQLSDALAATKEGGHSPYLGCMTGRAHSKLRWPARMSEHPQ